MTLAKAVLLIVMVCAASSAAYAQNWWQLAVWECIPGDCYDFAVGVASLNMRTAGICGGATNPQAASSIVSSCPNGLIDVSGYSVGYRTYMLTEQGWVERWIEGVGADAAGVSGSNTWQMVDEQYCDWFRYGWVQPTVPCG